jgi:hypothetical protein
LIASAVERVLGKTVVFVTIKQPGYALFSMTPSERAAIGVTDDQEHVHLLEKSGDGWKVAYDWSMDEHSHTELMVRLGDVPEPASVAELARLATGA